jgi:uncharacterized protein (TIGR02646 family)
MRYINKSKRCTEFDNWFECNTASSWDEFNDTNVKLALHGHLRREQQGLCIYCQQAIPAKTAKQSSAEIRSHIEHIRPRSPKKPGKYPELTFIYCNLSISGEGFDCSAKTPQTKEFCEHRKDDEYDESQFLNPTELPEIESYFEYDIEGGIFPNSKLESEEEWKKAEYMIKTLALDHKTLNPLRKEHYNAMLTRNADDRTNLLDPNGEILPAFYSMLKLLFIV